MLIEGKKAESKAIVKSLRASMSQTVDENLFQIISNSKEFFDEKSRSLEENWSLMAEQLRSAALDTSRPFSSNLHRRGEEKKYSVQFSEFLGYIAQNMSINVPLVTLIYAIVDLKNSLDSKYHLLDELSLIVGHVFVVLLILFANRWLLKYQFFRRLLVFLSLLFIDSVAMVISSSYLHRLLDIPNENLTQQIIHALFFFLLIFFVSMISIFISGSEAEKKFLLSRISQAQVEHRYLSREEARVSRELAKYLHGTIQSQLMASAIRLERAGRSGDSNAIEREANFAYSKLKLPSASYFSAPRHSLNEEIDKVIETWDNLMSVQVTIPDLSKNLEGTLIQDIGNAINEGLSNSFRHGSASNVKITILETDMGITISLIDDGSKPGKGTPGLGSQYFDTVSGSSWSLKASSAGGSHLTLKIDI
jgi:signal transduction histidine kinase